MDRVAVRRPDLKPTFFVCYADINDANYKLCVEFDGTSLCRRSSRATALVRTVNRRSEHRIPLQARFHAAQRSRDLPAPNAAPACASSSTSAKTPSWTIKPRFRACPRGGRPFPGLRPPPTRSGECCLMRWGSSCTYLEQVPPPITGSVWRPAMATSATVILIHGLQSHRRLVRRRWRAPGRPRAGRVTHRPAAARATHPHPAATSSNSRLVRRSRPRSYANAASEYPQAPIHLIGHCFGANLALCAGPVPKTSRCAR